MYYSEDIIEEVREATDIVELVSSYVNLKNFGSSYKGLCPFHNENTPSFSVSSSKQIYKCFGCGAGGNAYNFIIAMENLTFIEAVEYLASKSNIILPEKNQNIYNSNKVSTNQIVDREKEKKDKLYQLHLDATKFFYENLKNNKKIIEYVKSRGLTSKIIKKFIIGYTGVGWDNLFNYLKKSGYSEEIIKDSGVVVETKDEKIIDRFRDRLMFPIFDEKSRIIAFGGRDITEGKKVAKYINSPETRIYSKSKNLYGINFVKKNTQKENVFIVEGYIDLVTMFQNGFDNTLATLGTALTSEHIKLLKYKKSITLIFDNDEAGKKATLNAINNLKYSNFEIKVLELENAKDPDEYIKNFSNEAFLEETKNAKDYIDYQISNLLKEHDLENTREKIKFTKKALYTISHIDKENKIEIEPWLKKISKITNISNTSLEDDLEKIRNLALEKNSKFEKNRNNTLSKRKNIEYNINDNIKNNHLQIKKEVINNDKILKEAKIHILSCIAHNYLVYNTIKRYLLPEELVDDIYVEILSVLYKEYEKSKIVQIPKIFDYFLEINDEKKEILTNILYTKPNHIDPLNEKRLLIAINNHLEKIKRAYISFEKSKLDIYIDEEFIKLKELDQREKNISFNISALNG
ncbi:MAG: DNA primase [Defluviitaleaceae bacterium]|nr:DNA primase [Defluviitaleaceae bacterium]